MFGANQRFSHSGMVPKRENKNVNEFAQQAFYYMFFAHSMIQHNAAQKGGHGTTHKIHIRCVTIFFLTSDALTPFEEVH